MTFLDALGGMILVWFGYRGFKKGLTGEIGHVVGLLGAVIISMSWYVSLGGILSNLLPVHGYVIIGIAFSALFFPILIFFRIVFKLIEFFISTAGLNPLNNGLGLITGLVKGVLILSMVIWGLELINNSRWTDIVQSNFKYASKLSDIRKTVCQRFGWEDPVIRGSRFIEEWLSPDQHQN
jgi:membrane protein required for colicin V production